MPSVVANLSISLDGFAAGPHQDLDNPIGVGGRRLHEWMYDTAAWAEMHGVPPPPPNPDSDIMARMFEGVGAFIMGRNMFGPGRDAWDLEWRGWWGQDPPFHHPVFVLTHHPRDSLAMDGGTTFHFVTDGAEPALAQARLAAGGRKVLVSGGAHTVREFLRAGLIDEVSLHIVPIVLGTGQRLFEDVGDLTLTPVEVVAPRRVVHVTYRVDHAGPARVTRP